MLILAIGIIVSLTLFSGGICHMRAAINDAMQHTDPWRKAWSVSIAILDLALTGVAIVIFYCITKWYIRTN